MIKRVIFFKMSLLLLCLSASAQTVIPPRVAIKIIGFDTYNGKALACKQSPNGRFQATPEFSPDPKKETILSGPILTWTISPATTNVLFSPTNQITVNVNILNDEAYGKEYTAKVEAKWRVKETVSGQESDVIKDASVTLVAYQLLATNTLWLGLDRRDEGVTNKIGKGTATLTPPDPAIFKWKLKSEGNAPVVCILTNMFGNTTEYWTTNKESCSGSYLDQMLTVTTTISNAPPIFSIYAFTNFTVVRLDVTIDGIAETNEETVGAFVEYKADTNGLMIAEGTNAMKKVSITCKPGNLPTNEMVKVTSLANSLYEKIGEDLVPVPAETNYPACEISSKQFFLHGHAVSGDQKNRKIEVTHINSGAKDLAKYTVINLDLDVDNDTQLGGADDGVANYLPGYKGDTAVLSDGKTFLNPGYKGQPMTVVLDGIGTNGGFDEIVFVISGSSSKTGFCENATDDRISGEGKDDDFSFQAIGNKTTNTVTATSAAPEGKIEADRTWSRLYCKDYGGSCTIKVSLKKGGVVKFELKPLVVPVDEDKDNLADLYEKRQLGEWKVQYKLSNFDTNDLAFFTATYEQSPDQDEFNSGRPPCAEAGDGLTAAQEYRGYILDGGVNNFAGGHKRLTFARKNLLVEVMEMPGISDIANNNANVAAQSYTLASALAPVCDLYRHDTRGVAIEMYWVKHDIDRGPPYTYTNNVVVTNAYYYQGFLNYDTTGTNGIAGGMYVYKDGVLEREQPQRYLDLFDEHRSGNTQGEAFGRHHDVRLRGFLKLMMVSRYGNITRHNIKGPFPYFDAPGQNAISLINIQIFDKHLQGSRVSVNGISEEGIRYMQGNYTTVEFMQMTEYCVAHEIGHLIIQDRQGDGWDLKYHYNVPSGLMFKDVLRPGGITAVSFQDGEVRAINLPARASAE